VVSNLFILTKQERKIYFLLYVIGLSLVTIFGGWWFQLSHISHNFLGYWHIIDYVFFIVLSYIVWQEIVMEIFTWYIAGFIKKKERIEDIPVPLDNYRVAYVTAFVPGAEPYSVLEAALASMVSVDYPHDTWLLDEGDDAVSKQICKKYGVFYFSRKRHVFFNAESGKFARKTKGGNYNAWLHHFDRKYDIVAQHDVDFIPQKNFLTRTLGYFNDKSVAFVGTPQVYGNLDESWIARGAAEQTFGFYGPLQRGLHGHDMTLLIGANHIMRMDAYRDIDGYTAHITEDMLTGMKVYTRDWKSVYIPESLLLGEGPSTWSSYFGQQMRWSYGCMDIMFRHAPTLLPKMCTQHICNYLILMQFYFAGVAQVVGIVLLVVYFISGVTSASMSLLPIFTLYLPLIVFQSLFQLWLNRFNIDPKTENGLFLRGKLLFLSAWPIYFISFVGVVMGRRLTYVVTPKGDNQTNERAPQLFRIHFILGSITLAGIICGVYLHHSSLLMIFWALINTIFMYYFFFSEWLPGRMSVARI
jgi:cellulose synthase/poly-beta-1,6-N-acetylglucosamine synthase-like glycosyltransferase